MLGLNSKCCFIHLAKSVHQTFLSVRLSWEGGILQSTENTTVYQRFSQTFNLGLQDLSPKASMSFWRRSSEPLLCLDKMYWEGGSRWGQQEVPWGWLSGSDTQAHWYRKQQGQCHLSLLSSLSVLSGCNKALHNLVASMITIYVARDCVGWQVGWGSADGSSALNWARWTSPGLTQVSALMLAGWQGQLVCDGHTSLSGWDVWALSPPGLLSSRGEVGLVQVDLGKAREQVCKSKPRCFSRSYVRVWPLLLSYWSKQVIWSAQIQGMGPNSNYPWEELSCEAVDIGRRIYGHFFNLPHSQNTKQSLLGLRMANKFSHFSQFGV